MSTMRTIALAGMLALAGANFGCSFIFMEGPPSDHAKLSYFDCTSTYGLSVADGLFALSGGIGAGTALSQSKQAYADKNGGASRNAAAGADIVLAGITAASAVYGAVQATRCDRAKDGLKARIFAPSLRPPAPLIPPPLPPPGPPLVAPPGPPLVPPPGPDSVAPVAVPPPAANSP